MRELDYMITQQHHADGSPPTSQIVKRNNFVAPLPTPAKRSPAQILPAQATLDVPLSATQHVEVRTSDEDRARGFALRTRQLGIVISTAMVVASVSFVNVPLFSFWSLSIFVLTYAAVWLYAYYLALTRSAEGIAYNESNRKWDYLDRHQEKMWEHYERGNQ